MLEGWVTSMSTLGLVPARSWRDLRNLAMAGRVCAHWLASRRTCQKEIF